MDLYQIQYFLTISEVGSFNKASEKLFISQPSLSAGIKKLETELEVELFERTGRGIILTSAGKLFQRKAEEILQKYESLRTEIKQFKKQPTLKLGTLHTIRSYDLAQLLAKFSQKYPDVNIEILNGYLPELQNWLEQGHIDLAITWLTEENYFNTLPLFDQPFKLAVPNSHPYAKNKSVRLMDLDRQPYINRTNCEFWQSNPTMFSSVGVKPQFIYSSNNEEWVISLIQAGIGMSIMPVWSNLSDVIYIPILDLSLSRVVGLKWRKKQTLDAVQWFQECASDYHWFV